MTPAAHGVGVRSWSLGFKFGFFFILLKRLLQVFLISGLLFCVVLPRICRLKVWRNIPTPYSCSLKSLRVHMM